MTHHTIRLLVALSVLLAAPCSVAQDNIYGLFTIFTNQEGKIFLNGFPIQEDDASSDGSLSTTTFINQNVIEGQNVFRIELTDRRDKDTDALLPGILKLRVERGPLADDARIEAFMVERETRTVETGDEELTEFKTELGFESEVRGVLTGEATKLTLDTVTKAFDYSHSAAQPANLIEITFTATDVPLDTLPWLSPPVVPTAADEAAIAGVVTQLQTALANKDSAALLALIPNKIQRLAVGMGKPQAEMEAQIANFFSLLFNDAAFTFADVDVPGLQFETFPDVNLVRVKAADGSAAITGSGGGKEFALPLFFSRVGGNWVIVD